jgi:2-dehydropantoate 2-reductase
VLIYGAGAVGCYLGGMLAASGVPVTLLGRPALRDAIARDGLRIERPDGASIARIALPLITTIDQLSETPDLIILTTKAYDVAAALPNLASLIATGDRSCPAVLAVQNGVGTDETLIAGLPGTPIAAAALTNSLDAPEPGRIRLSRDRGGLAVAPIAGDPAIDHLVGLFASAGIVAATHDDYLAMKWSKLLLNLMGNAVSAVIGWTPARIYRDARLFAVERASFLEAVRVMRAMRVRPVSLPGFFVPILPWVMRAPAPVARRLLVRRASAGRGDKLPSLRVDALSEKGTSEVGWLNGAVVAAGERRGVPTPVNRRLVRLVDGVTRSAVLRRGFAERPDLLIQNIRLAPQ